MANLPEQAQWEDGIYQLETSDPVLAGPGGIDNRQATQLGNRTAFLKQKIEDINEALAQQAEEANPFDQYMLREAVAAQAGPLAWLGTASGTANALTFALPAGSKVDAYQGGQYFQFKAAAANTAGVTAKIGTLAAKAILKSGSAGLVALDAGDLKPGAVYALTFDGQQFQLGSGVNSSIAALPVGSMIPLPKAGVPTGFLELDGSVQSAATYPDLAAYLGTDFNRGDEGAGNFRLPDSRGEFFRGWDHGRGVDAGRILGSGQLDQFQGFGFLSTVAMQSTQAVNLSQGSTNGFAGPNTSPPAAWEYVAKTRGGSGPGLIGSDGVNGSPRTGVETRPRNLSVMWCIKAWSAPVNQGNIDVAALQPLAKQATETAMGVMRIASQMLVNEGLDDTSAVTSKTLAARLGGVLISGITMTAGGQVLLNHNLGVPPGKIEFVWVCVNAQNGWAAGEPIHGALANQSNPSSGATGMGVYWYGETSTQVTIGFGNGAWLGPVKGTGARAGVNLANFTLTARIKA